MGLTGLNNDVVYSSKPLYVGGIIEGSKAKTLQGFIRDEKTTRFNHLYNKMLSLIMQSKQGYVHGELQCGPLWHGRFIQDTRDSAYIAHIADTLVAIIYEISVSCCMKYVVTMRRYIKEPDRVIASVRPFRAVIIADGHSNPSL